MDKRISYVLFLCRNFYLMHERTTPEIYRKNSFYSKLCETLDCALTSAAGMQKVIHPEWDIEEKYPGYLFRITPPNTVYAPYNLVPIFPSQEMMEFFFNFAQKVKTTDKSILFLSGSSTTLKTTKTFNDIDFCEYLCDGKDELADKILEKTHNAEDKDFIEIKIGEKAVKSPVTETRIKKQVAKIDPIDPRKSYGKIDYILKAESERPSDVTNVMIFCNDHWESASLPKSFAAQEACLSPTTILPNPLNDPFEIGRYVHWLLEEIGAQLKNKKYLKAIKRSLSLARVSFLNNISDEIKDYLEGSHTPIENEIEEMNRLEEQIVNRKHSEKAEWLADLKHSIEIRSNELQGITLKNKQRKYKYDGVDVEQFAKLIYEKIRNEFGLSKQAA